MFHPPARNGGKLYYTGYFPEWEEGFCFCCLPAARGFLLPCVAAGASLVLAETCQPGNSTPRFLAAQRSAVSSRREEIAILRWRVNTQGSADPCAIPGELVLYCLTDRASSTVFASTLFLDCNCKLVCSSYNDQTAGQQTWQSFAAARHFCSAKILAGELRWGWGPQRSRQRHRPRKEISRGNLLCAKSGPTNLSYPRRLSTQKYVTTLDKRILNTGQPQGARGTAVPLFREESRGTPSKGFLWATSSRRLDTALLCAAKKRGVETSRLAGPCQSTPGPWTTGPVKKPPRCRARQ